MKAKNKPEPQEVRKVASSVELNVRPNAHWVLGKRAVLKGQRFHAEDDAKLIAMSHIGLCQALGYKGGGMSAYAALAAEIINQMPPEYRMMALDLIASGQAMELAGGGSEGPVTISRVQKYPPLEIPDDTPSSSAPSLWTPDQGRP